MTSLPSAYLFVLVTLVGLFIGSFLNVVIYRLPIMLEHDFNESEAVQSKPMAQFDLLMPRSHCPLCKKTLRVYELIPVLSFVMLKGRCRGCQRNIPRRYPMVELLTAASFVTNFWVLGDSLQTVFACLFSSSLIVLAFIDVDQMILPDVITLPLIWMGLILSTEHLFVAPEDSILGAVIGYLALWSVDRLYLALRGRHGLGGGDFKLMAAIGAWLGWMSMPTIILNASGTGLAYALLMLWKRKLGVNSPIYFGPFLSLSGWIALLLL